MAKGPRYRKPFRRRAEGKTNYRKRLKLLKSRKIRCVIRVSSNHVEVQFVQSKIGGDKVLVSAFSKELENKFDWKANTGNIPASYLTGYLAGLRAKKQNIEDVIFDLGIIYHKNRVLAACHGVIDAEIEIPYREDLFPESLSERIDGSHIENYAKLLKKEDPEKYQKVFSRYLSQKKLDPVKITQLVSTTKKKIQKAV